MKRTKYTPIARKRPQRRLSGKKGGSRNKRRELWAQFGLPVPKYIRYSGLRGVYWFLFSQHIRERDYREHGGLCMTCLKYVEKGQDQCGHFFPARNCGFLLLLHPKNNHLQHSKCNNPRFTPDAGIRNTINLTERYGPQFIQELLEIKATPNQKEWSKKEYEQKIRALQSHYNINKIRD